MTKQQMKMPKDDPDRLPGAARQRAVWATISRRSTVVALVGGLLLIPYVISYLISFTMPFIKRTLGAAEHDLTIQAIIAGLGVLMILGGVSIAVIARSEYRKLGEKPEE